MTLGSKTGAGEIAAQALAGGELCRVDERPAVAAAAAREPGERTLRLIVLRPERVAGRAQPREPGETDIADGERVAVPDHEIGGNKQSKLGRARPAPAALADQLDRGAAGDAAGRPVTQKREEIGTRLRALPPPASLHAARSSSALARAMRAAISSPSRAESKAGSSRLSSMRRQA